MQEVDAVNNGCVICCGSKETPPCGWLQIG
jgi:hypothetical protein